MENRSKWSVLWELFFTFFKIGAFTFGGGYAMIPLIQAEVVEKKGYIEEDTFLSIIAIAESTPGVIAVNSATFVGYRIGGFWGALFSTCGVVFPSFCIIVGIATFYDAFISITWVDWAFQGIRSGVIVLVFGAFIKLSSAIEKNAFTIAIMSITFLVGMATDLPVALLIITGAVLGILRQLYLTKKGGKIQ